MRRRRKAAREDEPRGAHTLEVRRGAIVGFNGDDVFVELGPRMQGVISRRAFAEPPEVGEVHDFTLRGQEEGLWVLSLQPTKALVSWESMSVGSLVQARVVRPAQGGLEVKVGPLHAFLPRSHSGLPRGQALEGLVGKTVTCEVIEIDSLRQRVFVSRKLVQKRERESERYRQVSALKPGQVVQGRVTRIEDYGAFVRFGRGMEGLVHISNLSHERLGHPSEVVSKGDQVSAKVLYIGAGGKRISLGLRQVDADPWREFSRQHRPGEVLAGTVTRLEEYGAFVSVATGIEGLLHRSEAGIPAGEHLRAQLRVGQALSVRLLDIDPERERLGLSRVHASGAPIAPEEALQAREFAEFSAAEAPEQLKANLGWILRASLPGEAAPEDPETGA